MVKHIGLNSTLVNLRYQAKRPKGRLNEFGRGLSRKQQPRCGWIVNR
jgi:hypothetical protein